MYRERPPCKSRCWNFQSPICRGGEDSTSSIPPSLWNSSLRLFVSRLCERGTGRGRRTRKLAIVNYGNGRFRMTHPLHPRPVLAGTRTEDILLIRLQMPSRHWVQRIHRIAGAIMSKQYKKVVKRARRKQYVARVKARQRQAQKDRNSS